MSRTYYCAHRVVAGVRGPRYTRLSRSHHSRRAIGTCSAAPSLLFKQQDEISDRRQPLHADRISYKMKQSRHHASHSSNSASTRSAEDVDDWEMGCQIVADLAAKIRESVRSYTMRASQLTNGKSQRTIKLVGITTSGAQSDVVDEDAEAYSEHIASNFSEDGIGYDLWRVPADPQKVEAAIYRAEEIVDVHGVLVFYPIFKKVPNIQKLSSFLDHTRTNVDRTIESLAPGQSTLMFSSSKDPTDWTGKRGPYKNKMTGVYYKTFDDYFRDIIPASLDVEGLCHDYNARLMSKYSRVYVDRSTDDENEGIIFPCTALAVARILESCYWGYNASSLAGQRLRGSVITIVNRSEIFGRPLAAMLANDGAMVFSVDIDSIVAFKEGGRNHRYKPSEIALEDCIRQSSVVVTAVPSPSFQIPANWIQKDTTVINVACERNIDEDALRAIDKPGITYIPHIGQVTVALLEHNLVLLHRRYHAAVE